MFPGPEHRRDSDPRSADVWARSRDSGFWHRIIGRNRSGREDVRGLRQTQRLLRTDGRQYDAGLCWARNRGSRDGDGQRRAQTLRIALLLLSTACMISCSHRLDSPQVAFENADRAFVHRDLQQSKDEAREKYEELRGSAPYWALKFRILEAKAALWQGLFPDVLKLLKSVPQNGHLDIDIPTLTLLGVAHAHLQEYSDSERLLSSATGLCSPPENSACGDVLQARGLLASEHGDSASAEELFSRSLSFARSHHDSFLEATSLL